MAFTSDGGAARALLKKQEKPLMRRMVERQMSRARDVPADIDRQAADRSAAVAAFLAGSRKNSPLDQLARVARTADRLTGASQLASDAVWSFTHPVDRLTGKGRAANQQMAVPWVASKPWFHGSAKAFEKFDPSLAKSEGMYGPAQYLTDSASRASDYALESGALQGANVTMFNFAPNRVLDVADRLSKQQVKRVLNGVRRAARREDIPIWNADLTIMSKGWRGAPAQAVYEQLAERFGKEFANRALARGGFDAIAFKEGPMGGIQRDALAVLRDRHLRRGR